jgi:hypothetical protein
MTESDHDDPSGGGGMNRLESSGKKGLGIALLIVAIPALNGCSTVNGTVNLLQGIRLGDQASEITMGTRQLFVLEGKGTCQSVNVDWGDGTIEQGVVPVTGQRIEFETSNIETRYLRHAYSGWGGGKTITVEGAGCEGKLRGRFNASPSERRIGWAQPAPPGTTGVCQTVAGLPGMIPRMLVHVSLSTVPVNIPGVRDIHFGCFGGVDCMYNADGRPGTVADSRFPFPGLREYSVVFRIGSQIVQGGTDTRFTTTASGPLEFCLNDGDNNLTNNEGGFDVTISVDQLGP